MKKEDEELLNEILAEPRVVISNKKNIHKYLDRMEPMSDSMRDYMTAYLTVESDKVFKILEEIKFSKMSISERKAFDSELFHCLENQLNYFNQPVLK